MFNVLASSPQYREGGDVIKQEIKLPFLGTTDLAFSTNNWSNSRPSGKTSNPLLMPVPGGWGLTLIGA